MLIHWILSLKLRLEQLLVRKSQIFYGLNIPPAWLDVVTCTTLGEFTAGTFTFDITLLDGGGANLSSAALVLISLVSINESILCISSKFSSPQILDHHNFFST